MRKSTVALASVVVTAALVLVGCHHEGWRPCGQIAVGQSQEDIVTVRGQPDQKTPTRWVYENAYLGHRLVVPMHDGRVVSRVGFEPPSVPTP
ncbi:MAG TPA: hypothetical protein ENN87_00305 [Phycisphaerales bacterium]|nr:hypothetical protein [Phycisphaerales bacterium]